MFDKGSTAVLSTPDLSFPSGCKKRGHMTHLKTENGFCNMVYHKIFIN